MPAGTSPPGRDRRGEIRDLLTEYGAVLLRGFETGGPEGLQNFVRAFSGSEPLPYSERSSPRSTIQGRVYNSTDYPAVEEIFLHNENSYQSTWPMTLYFYCIEAPDTIGTTTLADIRIIRGSIDPSVHSEFEARRWKVVRNYHEKFGVRWKDVFGTEDKDAVNEYCRRNGIVAEWQGAGLRTSVIRDAVHRHPLTASPSGSTTRPSSITRRSHLMSARGCSASSTRRTCRRTPITGTVASFRTTRSPRSPADFPGEHKTLAGLHRLSLLVDERLGEADAVVVTTGSGEMTELAYWLDPTVRSPKPVVVTGVMRPWTVFGSDGPADLFHAVVVAAGARTAGSGAVLVMNDLILAAHEAIKTDTTAVHSFQSPSGRLGTDHGSVPRP